MKRLVGLIALCLGLTMSFGLLAPPAWGYLGILQSLGEVVNDSKVIVAAMQDDDPKVRRLAASVLQRLGLEGWIGYTAYRAGLPGGRHANQTTMRAFLVRADGTKRHALAEELTKKPDTWTQFTGWSPDGRLALIYQGANTPENAALEEKQGAFRHAGRSGDCFTFDLATKTLTNLTGVERVSQYNMGLHFWPDDPKKLVFVALIDGQWRPFSMDADGRNKKDLAKGAGGFVYGVNVSPDGKHTAYTRDYQLFLADGDVANAGHIKTGHPFNFVPTWSPDSQWLLFLAGEHYNCHPHILRNDGTGLRKVGDRQGYKGVVAILDVHDYHGGSSDIPVWSPDGKWIYYTARVGDSVEIMRTSLEGKPQQLSHSKPKTLNYHPAVSPNGQWLVFGSNRSGVRQLYVMPAEGGAALAITGMKSGEAAMWPYWQPGAKR
jgi:Tol biopolymer transport system component